MGELICLGQWRDAHSGAAQFVYDPACPLSYLAAEHVERSLGQVDWIPAVAAVSRPEAVRAEALKRARALHLPLVWPDRYPAPVPRAARAAAHAAAAGFGARFGLAALRLAFCGGFDLDDPAILSEAAAAAGIGPQECLQAADNPALDAMLVEAAVPQLPAIRIGHHLFNGEQALAQAAGLLQARTAVQPAVAQLAPA